MTQPEFNAPKPDPRAARATTSPGRLLFLTAQLAALSALMRWGHPSYFPLSLVVLGGFVVHYWMPFRFKETFWLLLSLVGGTYLVGTLSPGGGGHLVDYAPMGVTVLVGLVIYGIVASPAPYWVRFGGVVAVYAGIIWA